MRNVDRAIIIRRALVSDARALSRIVNEKNNYYDFGAQPFSSEQDWRQSLDNANLQAKLYIVAEINARPVGFSCMTIKGNTQPISTLTFSVIVDKESQRQGVGRALVNTVIDHAFRWHGVNRIELEVFTGNYAAKSLYNSLQFKLEGIRKQAVYRDGCWVDVEMMALLREEYFASNSACLKR